MSGQCAPAARLFFALNPDLQTRRSLMARQRRLDWPGRAVPPDNLHLTLAFLGQVPAGRVALLGRIASSLRLPAVSLVLNQSGMFPRARVGWVGPSTVPRVLLAFQQELVDGLIRASFAVDRRPWVPHITLYRNLRTEAVTLPIEPVTWPIRRYVLMESIRSRAGPHYAVTGHWSAVDSPGRPRRP